MIVKVAAALTVVVVMLLGIVGLGRLASSDVQAMVMTTVFLLLGAVAIGILVRRRRDFAVALIAPFLLIAGVSGVWLGLPLVTDRTVNEEVVSAASPAAPDSSSTTGPALVASGQFEAASHPGTGTASLIALEDGAGVVTFTDFETDNGPDLLVYLVPADAAAGSADGAVPLGGLKGNRGDQQYDVPSGTDLDAGWRVVVWCRAFAVSFTEAPLST
ncbi:MAG: DM13 domain-containing protein [Candidatus Nanopelagicales bacterium]|jgi:hypothetical protein|nr:DM13 domain-containing protein [Candidatus Nanopelagicales bacterium]